MRTFSKFGDFSRDPARQWRGLAVVVVLALLTGLCWGREEGPDDKYVAIYKIIQKADGLSETGKTDQARTNYVQAQVALTAFQREYPYWNTKLVAHRLSYVMQKLTAPPPPPPSATEAGGTNASKSDGGGKSGASAANVQIKLLEPGAEPRKELRLHPAAGDKQTLQLTVKMAMENSVAGTETPAMTMPAIKLNFDSTVKEVAANGDVTYEMVMGGLEVADEAGASPQVAAAMKTAFEGVKDVSGTGMISSRGVGQGTEFKAPAGANPAAKQVLDQMKDFCSQLAEPFPEEAVGVGAKWEVKTPIKSQGMTITQTTTYELMALDGEQVTTKSTVVQQAGSQKIQNPAMPGLKMDLTKMSSRGSGERLIDLAKLLPASGSGDVHTEMSMTMGVQGKTQAMSMKMDIKVSFESK